MEATSSPPKCRCGTVLILGDTWPEHRYRAGKKECKACTNAAKYRWIAKNPEKHAGYLAKNQRSVLGRYKALLKDAKRRGHECTLTFDEYAPLLKLPCHYCGLALNETGSGLDRRDNSRGYIPGNVVPCCNACNRAKSDLFNEQAMLLFIGPGIREAKLFMSANEPEVTSDHQDVLQDPGRDPARAP